MTQEGQELTFLLLFGSGLAAGFVHVVMGPDHLAALMPLSVGKRWRAGLLGIRWGIGHSVGVLVIALIAVLLKEHFNLVDILGGWAERLVGVMLIAIGLFGIRRALRIKIHIHSHLHGDEKHNHLHVHQKPADETDLDVSHHHAHQHTALFAGTLHGVAGTSHFFGVLPAVAMDGWFHSLSYLIAFTVGTIAAMGGFAAFLGVATSKASANSPLVLKRFLMTAASFAILVGIVWIVFPFLGLELP